MFDTNGPTKQEISLGEMAAKVKAGEADRIEVRGNTVTLFSGEVEYIIYKEAVESVSEILVNYGVTDDELRAADIKIKTETGLGYWMTVILPFLLPVLLIVGLIYMLTRQVQGVNKRVMSFGNSEAKSEKSDSKKKKVKFNEVAGAKEAKSELEEIVQFLKHPRKFIELGAKIPKGVQIGRASCRERV